MSEAAERFMALRMMTKYGDDECPEGYLDPKVRESASWNAQRDGGPQLMGGLCDLRAFKASTLRSQRFSVRSVLRF